MTSKLRTNPRITSAHLDRKAVVYLRQSSQKQVRNNLESRRLQYALADLAREWGWTQVEVIDTDLGCSSAVGAAPREGFERLVASVAMGEVGIVLSREVSRLSRTDRDWCRLLEVCQLFGTLLGDAEQVYDLGLLDDQLVLGIKGTLSVVELKVLRMRLLQGMEEKARRGELVRLLPPGYVRDAAGKVVKDPDARVREAIGLVFSKFRETWSVRQTFLWFHAEGVELPVNKSRDARMRIVWQLPTHAFVAGVLHNPSYAGAYVYGRRVTETVLVDGRVLKRGGKVRRPEEWKVCLWDHHEGYVDRETFEENLRMIRSHALNTPRDEAVSTVRSGQGLLAGLLRCGRCGRKLHVRYWGKSGTAARYVCKGDYDAGGRYCLAFGGSTVDKRFGKELLEVLSPLGVRAGLVALERLRTTGDGRRQVLRRQLEHLAYEVRRAFEQYDEADPRHRLVAAELERRWNQKLEEVERARAALDEAERETPVLAELEREEILALGERFAHVWNSGHCPVELKKKIVRTVVEEAVVELDDSGETLRFVVHWKGGTHTRFEMARPPSGVGRKTSLEDLEIIGRMAVRYGDDEIARVLNKLGRRTATGKRWSEQRVATARRRYAIPGQKRSIPDPEILTLGRSAKRCGVSQTTIKRLVAGGVLAKEQVAPWAPWEIRRSDLDADPVRGILERLKRTGKLVLEGDDSERQPTLFPN